MAYDAVHGKVVLFGGSIPNGNGLGDTWVWDGKNWTKESPPASPQARFTHGMAYDALHHQVVLFGGHTQALLNDTWVWDGAKWTQKNSAASPSSRFAHSMAYDSAHGQTLLFGGQTVNAALLNDTWLWDGTKWTQATPGARPSVRYYSAMAYDSAHGQVVLFGGGDTKGHLFNDTWVWDGTNWTQQSPAHTPPARVSPAMAYDAAHGQVVLYGGSGQTSFGDTWTWDGSDWTEQNPTSNPGIRNVPAMAYDSTHNQVVMFGGFTTAFANDTWTWVGVASSVTPVVKAVVNGASFLGGGVVPGEIATAFGTNLTSTSGINLTSSLPLPSAFLNDAVIVNNKPVALFAVDNVNGQEQINFQVPWEVASGPKANIAVSNNGTTSASISVAVLPAQPGIFNYTVGGNVFGAILHSSFQLADTAHPAKAGETVLIYCTGLGAVSSPPADGAAGDGQPTVVVPTVTIGGAKAIVSFSGLAPGFVGLYQINAEVPTGLASGNHPVLIEMAGASSNSVLLAVE